jgi:hypothetical protein
MISALLSISAAADDLSECKTNNRKSEHKD